MSGSTTYTAVFVISNGSGIIVNGHSTGQPPGGEEEHAILTGAASAETSVLTEFNGKTVDFDLTDPFVKKIWTLSDLHRATAALHIWRALWEADFARQKRGLGLTIADGFMPQTYTLTAAYTLPNDANVRSNGYEGSGLIASALGTTATFDVTATGDLSDSDTAAMEQQAAVHMLIHSIWLMDFARWQGDVATVKYTS